MSTCKTCIHHHAGTCHFGPPSAHPMMMAPTLAGQAPRVNVLAVWPPVKPDDWCSQHPARQAPRVVASGMVGSSEGSIEPFRHPIRPINSGLGASEPWSSAKLPSCDACGAELSQQEAPYCSACGKPQS